MPQKISSPVRPITIVGPQGTQRDVRNVVGVDESQGGRDAAVEVFAAVRNSRHADIPLVRSLIDNDLYPFQYKANKSVTVGPLNLEQRSLNVKRFLTDLQDLPVTWSAVVVESGCSPKQRATAAAMASKKSITNGLSSGDVSHDCGETALIHDGEHDCHSQYFEALQQLLRSHIDTSFEQSICPVFPTFQQGADFLFPQTIAADYIANYLQTRLSEISDATQMHHEQIETFEDSWVDPHPKLAPIHELSDFQPIRGHEYRSRVLAWMFGQGISDKPDPVGQDPYREMIEEIQDETVYEYLCDLG